MMVWIVVDFGDVTSEREALLVNVNGNRQAAIDYARRKYRAYAHVRILYTLEVTG